MSVTYGFYNSINGDRKYNALEMSSIFDGIIVDGVYMSIGDALNVKSSGGMSITVGIGRAWFNHTWTLNDSLLPLTLANSDVLLNRIDAIVLEVNNSTEVRKNTIKILKGTPSSKPVKPSMAKGELVNQHPLAYISVPKGATSISQSNITNAVGTSECPFVTGVLEGMDIDKLVAQWGAQWAEWLSSNTDAWKAFMSSNTNEWKSFMTKNKTEWSDLINGNTSEFETWFENMKDQLSEDAAGNLQLQVDNLNNAALGGGLVMKGTPVSIAYAGAQRIASITAYGENAQGGTTEAPVALTGVDSVQVCGKNMLPNKAKTNTVAGITYTVNPNKSVTAKGTATSWSNIVIDADFSLPAGTYTLNSNIQTAGVSLVIGKDTSGKKNIAVSSTASKTFTLSDSIKHCVAYIAVAPDSVVDTTIRPMLNLGKTAMPYEPYKGNVTQLPIPRPLRKVGDVRDVCRTRVKSVYDKRIVLDGTENWNISSSKPNSFLTPVSERIVNGLSDSYPTLKSPEIGTKNGIYLNYTADIIVTDLACSTVEEFKAHLSAHPLTVYYRSTAYDGTNGLDVCLTEYQTGYIESYADESITTAWISSTGALSTGAEVAYVLSSPETYATDPLDIDNAAGPLTVMTGGELEAAFKSADKVVESRIDFVEDTLNEQGQAIAEKAPISHSSDKSTYGLGSGSQFGHVKLSDATASGSNAGQGIAATPSAVNQVNARVSTVDGIARAAMPKSGGTFTGNVLASSANEAGAFLRNISVQNSASQLQYTNFIIMVRK